MKEILCQIKQTFLWLRFYKKRKKEISTNTSEGGVKDEVFDFPLIKKFHENENHHDAFQVLSDKTCNDLDFDELFMVLDRTNSKVGQQYLYDQLRTIKRNKPLTDLNERLISRISEDVNFRKTLAEAIGKLNQTEAYYISGLFQDKHIKAPSWYWIIPLLSISSLLVLVSSFFYPVLFLVLIGIYCINFFIHYWNKNNLYQYVSSIPQLLKLNAIASRLYSYSELKEINPNLAPSIKQVKAVKRSMSFFQLQARLQGDSELIAWFIFELFKTLFLLEPLLLFGVLKRLDSKREEIKQIFNFVGHLDMLISIADLRKGFKTYCIPDIHQKHEIVAENLSHPLVENCTLNSIRINEKSILLTGSNMSGKTTFIRALGINILTGLTINTCFAKSMSFPLLRIYSAIRISDDLMNDKSYYFEEVLTIKEMLKEGKSGIKNLFLLDELFKGTNTVERIAAGKAVLSYLAGNSNFVLVSTHDIELTDLLHSEYELYHFSETVENNKVGFDYKLKSGKLKTRNAIRILEINAYPSELIREAFEIAKKMDNNFNE